MKKPIKPTKPENFNLPHPTQVYNFYFFDLQKYYNLKNQKDNLEYYNNLLKFLNYFFDKEYSWGYSLTYKEKYPLISLLKQNLSLVINNKIKSYDYNFFENCLNLLSIKSVNFTINDSSNFISLRTRLNSISNMKISLEEKIKKIQKLSFSFFIKISNINYLSEKKEYELSFYDHEKSLQKYKKDILKYNTEIKFYNKINDKINKCKKSLQKSKKESFSKEEVEKLLIKFF